MNINPWRIGRFLLRSCSLSHLSYENAKRVRIEQVNSLSLLIAVMSLMGLGTVGLIAYEFREIEQANQAVAWSSVSIVTCYLALLVLSARWISDGKRAAVRNAGTALRQFVVACFALGTSWGCLFTQLLWLAQDDKRNLLYGLVIGLVSSGALVAPASVAVAFWLPTTIAGFVASVFVSDTQDISTAVLLLGYTTMTLFCIVYLNRALIKRAVSEIAEHDGRELIGILLNDFEESACDWLWETDGFGRLTYVSDRFAQVVGVSSKLLEKSDFLALLGGVGASSADERVLQPRRTASLASLMARHESFRDVEVSLVVGTGPVWWTLTGKPRFSAQNVFEGYRGVGSDVTQERTARNQARFLAQYDELTGLANRRLFHDTLNDLFSRPGSPTIGVLYLDLDRFKGINDKFGHVTGDKLLAEVARRLKQLVASPSLCARLGGDEFAIVVEDFSQSDIESLAGEIVAAIATPFDIENLHFQIGVSIGMALASAGRSSGDEMLRNADLALYQAKANGRGQAHLYDHVLQDRDTRRDYLQTALLGAVDRNELSLEFQPIFNLATLGLIGLEALLRWECRPYGAIGPDEFIPLAESCGVIEILGEWAFNQACYEGRNLPASVRLAVNVSPLQLGGARLAACLRRLLTTSTTLAPSQLDLEITETAFFEMTTQSVDLLHDIRKSGIRVTLDDFGAGQTSLGQIRRFPFDSLKIDRSFVQDLPHNHAATAIVRSLNAMAAELGIDTTAEGIETAEQLRATRAVGCSHAQGFYLGRPMSMKDAIATFNIRETAPPVIRETASPVAMVRVDQNTKVADTAA